MFVFTFVLSLSMAMVGQAQQQPFQQDMNASPLSERLMLFDVTSDADPAAVKASLAQTQIRHSYKVIAENRYFFVCLSQDVNVLNSTRFPAGSISTQYSVEHIKDYFASFGFGNGTSEVDTSSQLTSNIVELERNQIIIPVGTTSDQFKAMIKNFSQAISDFRGSANAVTYAVAASYPPMFFWFGEIRQNPLQQVAFDFANYFGGPGNFKLLGKLMVPF